MTWLRGREYLMQDEESGYTHPYAFKNVDPAILEAVGDPRRQQAAEQLTSEDEESGGSSASGAAESLFPTQGFMLELAGFVLERRRRVSACQG